MTRNIKVNRPLNSMRFLLRVGNRNLNSSMPAVKVMGEAISLRQSNKTQEETRTVSWTRPVSHYFYGRRSNSQSYRTSTLNIHWKDYC